MSKIKILHVITRLDLGGSSENTLLTVLNLDKNKYETTLLSGPTENPIEGLMGRIKNENISFVEIKQLRRQVNIIQDTIAFLKIYNFIKKGEFTIVHTHTSKAGVLGRLAAKLNQAPIIIHTSHGHIFYGYYGVILSKLIVLLERFLAIFTDRLITLTQLGKEEFLKFKIAPARKVMPIYSGIDIEKFTDFQIDVAQEKERLNIPLDSPIIGTVSRLEPVKGNEYFIESLPQIVKVFPNIKVLIVGDGTQRERLGHCVNANNLSENVIFMGRCQDVRRILSILDIFVLASLNEGMGRGLLEAQILGIPVIATKVSGIPEVVKDGITGVLVPARNPKAMVEAIINLLKDKPLREKMSEEAKKWVDDKFSAETMVNKISDLYEELIKEKGII